jgi:hypothetical protein
VNGAASGTLNLWFGRKSERGEKGKKKLSRVRVEGAVERVSSRKPL